MDPALEAILEGSLAATACMNLRLDHDTVLVETRQSVIEVFHGMRNASSRHADTCLSKKFLGLIFVYVH